MSVSRYSSSLGVPPPTVHAPPTGGASRRSELDPPAAGGCRLASVGMSVTIGDFSRMTHLSVKTLRHYHSVGLLEPADVDPGNGYRYYGVEQIPHAQVIPRL